jgi:hypothetical protein
MRLNTDSLRKALLSIVAIGGCILMATAADAAMMLPSFNAGLPAPGFPDFTGNVGATVFLDSGGFLLEAGNGYGLANSNTFFDLSPTLQYAVQNENYSLSAQFNSRGVFEYGMVKIYGQINSLGVGYQNLYTASFDKAGLSFNTFGIGFETTNVGDSGWATKYQSGPESVYLYDLSNLRLGSQWDFSGWHVPVLSFNALQITTVPLPAALWLLLSSLGALLMRARHRLAAM